MVKTKVTKTDSTAGAVQSLTRGLIVLEKISENKGGVALTDLALQVGLPNSTLHRLLITLQQQGFVTQKGDLGHWYIDAKAFTVGSAFFSSRDLVSSVYPILSKLMAQVGETVNLLVFEQSSLNAVIISQVQCTELMRMVAPIGSSLPLHASGGGKALLATFTDDDVKSIIKSKGLKKYTDYTIITQQGLLDELSKIRQQGYSADLEEQVLGLHCVSAAFYDENGRAIGAISISGPKIRIGLDRITFLGAKVMEAADDITKIYAGFSFK
ncbi:glyoxylate bypass operon transcriptional repressor IclR [Orbus sasakiae]|uniref:Glyoxylate bypass operon transcriptional repressor IclR n=1 Tax=Orbus sasakiae TaxID=1078475 RepID=A0ABP9MYD4_9GAMM